MAKIEIILRLSSVLNAHKQRDIGDDGSKNKTLERQKLRSIPFSFSSVFFLSLCSFSLAALLWCVLFDSFISISSSLMLLAFYSFFFSLSLSSLLFSFRIRMCARRASYFDSICKTYRLNRLRYVVQSRNIFFAFASTCSLLIPALWWCSFLSILFIVIPFFVRLVCVRFRMLWRCRFWFIIPKPSNFHLQHTKTRQRQPTLLTHTAPYTNDKHNFCRSDRKTVQMK